MDHTAPPQGLISLRPQQFTCLSTLYYCHSTILDYITSPPANHLPHSGCRCLKHNHLNFICIRFHFSLLIDWQFLPLCWYLSCHCLCYKLYHLYISTSLVSNSFLNHFNCTGTSSLVIAFSLTNPSLYPLKNYNESPSSFYFNDNL